MAGMNMGSLGNQPDEVVRSEIETLRLSMEQMSKESAKLSKQMLILTWVTAGLAFVQVVIAIVK